MKAALTKHVEDLVCLEVSALSSLTDYYVIGSGNSEPQMRAIIDAVEVALSKKGCRRLSIEGMAAATWVLMDYDDVIFHLFRKESRAFYNLDRLWADAPRMALDEMPPSEKKKPPVKRKKKEV